MNFWKAIYVWYLTVMSVELIVVIVFNWNHLRWGFLIWELIFIYCRLFVLILVVFFFLCCFFFHYISAKFHLWPSSGDLLRPWIGMMSLVTVSPLITAFHSYCLSHHVFDQVNLWLAWVGFETAIFWQCSPGTVETQCLYPLRHVPRRGCLCFVCAIRSLFLPRICDSFLSIFRVRSFFTLQ